MRKIDFFRALPKLPPPLPPIWASCTTIFGRQKQRLAHITEPSNDDYDTDVSDHNFDFLMNLVLKMTKKYHIT